MMFYQVLIVLSSSPVPLIIPGLHFKQAGLFEIQADFSQIKTRAEGEYFL